VFLEDSELAAEVRHHQREIVGDLCDVQLGLRHDLRCGNKLHSGKQQAKSRRCT
jgi:hypothetical protein